MIGQTISHYKILEKLGEGGMGVVYKAEDTKLDRLVALKFLPPHLATDEKDKQRFIQEAKAASALDHPNICTIHEVDETHDGQLFIAMAYYERETLHQKIANRQLSIDDCLAYAFQIAEGLHAAHEKGIVHRDIKSSNVMVTEKGQVKIMDFGLARTTGATMLTKSGATVGTVPYMSPEQARGEKVDHRTDIWSLGVVLYEMISNRLPFHSPYSEAIVYSILNEEPKPFSLVRSDVPSEVENIVKKCLQKNPANRYQHADQLIVDLRRATSEVGNVEQKIPNSRRVNWRNWYLIGGGASLVALLLLIFLPRFTSRDEVIRSIAVLPVANLSHDPEQEYFADGMTEALITDLAKISSLRVISRTSVMRYKATQKSIPEIAKELNVDAVVEGSVQRSGERVRITAQLIDAAADRHLWAKSYERDLVDVLALQSEVAQGIVHEIQIELTPQEQAHLAGRGQVNPEAYQAYLLGRYYWNKRTEEGLKKAIAYFQQAIDQDPYYALAYAGLADCYVVISINLDTPPKESFPKAKALAMKALEMDDALAEAHTALAYILAFFEWDWSAAEREFKRAITLNPNYAVTHLWYARYLSRMERHLDALAEGKRAQELDPLSPIINSLLGRYFYQARQYDQAIEQLRKTLEIDPNFWIAHIFLGSAYEQKGMYEQAIAELYKAKDLSGGPTEALSLIGYVYAVWGNRSEAQKVLEELQGLSKQGYVPAYNIAIIHAGLREKDRAFEWLEKAYEERGDFVSSLKVEPKWDNLRADPRFRAVLKKVGFEK